MPVHVEHKPIKGGRDWAIMEGKHVVARSTSQAKAKASARARNAAHAQKGKHP